MNSKKLYALDFDGVLCDSAVETALTGWTAAGRLWAEMPPATPPALVERFREVRPIIETGYEAILAMRLLFLGETPDTIYRNYGELTQTLLAQVDGGVEALKQLFGDTRDRWIAEDLAGWVAKNPLFPGVALKLNRLLAAGVCTIVTTKQERFVKQILSANAINFPEARIFGLDRKLSKPEVLSGLLHEHSGQGIVFLEDRLATLEKVLAVPELAEVDLVFALWGYNTEAEKRKAGRLPVRALALNEFLSA